MNQLAPMVHFWPTWANRKIVRGCVPRLGFEPKQAFRPPDLQSGAIVHSAISA